MDETPRLATILALTVIGLLVLAYWWTVDSRKNLRLHTKQRLFRGMFHWSRGWDKCDIGPALDRERR